MKDELGVPVQTEPSLIDNRYKAIIQLDQLPTVNSIARQFQVKLICALERCCRNLF